MKQASMNQESRELNSNVIGLTVILYITKMICSSDRTEWCPTRSVIIRVINRIGRVRLETDWDNKKSYNHKYNKTRGKI